MALRALRAPAWEVRNAAGLALATLFARVLGFRNPSGNSEGGGAGSAAVRRAVTAADFFYRCAARGSVVA